jgi:hypothetical protein
MNMASSPASRSGALSNSGNIAPIALFVYNRLGHTQRTVDSLRKNDLASQSDLFVFSDGARNEAGSSAVQQIRKYIRTIQGFKSVTIIERERNLGLAGSLIGGTTELCHSFGRVIVMEDDLLTTVDFLTFINQALDRYETEPRVFSISGFNFGFDGPHHYPCDAFLFYRSSSLGWGTWKDRWEQADWEMADYYSFCNDKGQQRQFNRGGEDLSNMLALQMHGKIDSWAIRWAYAHFKQDACALLSLRSRVLHIGSDALATHSRWKSFKQSPLTDERKSDFRYPDTARLDDHFVRELQRSLRPSLARKLARYLLRGRISLATSRRNFRKPLPTKTEHSVGPEASRSPFVD